MLDLNWRSFVWRLGKGLHNAFEYLTTPVAGGKQKLVRSRVQWNYVLRMWQLPVVHLRGVIGKYVV